MSGGQDPQLNFPGPAKVLWKSLNGTGSGEGPQARGVGLTRATQGEQRRGHVWGARYVTGGKTPYCYGEARKFPRDLFHTTGPDSSTFSLLFSPVRSGSRIGGSQAFCVQSALSPPLPVLPHPTPAATPPPSSLTPYLPRPFPPCTGPTSFLTALRKDFLYLNESNILSLGTLNTQGRTQKCTLTKCKGLKLKGLRLMLQVLRAWSMH